MIKITSFIPLKPRQIKKIIDNAPYCRLSVCCDESSYIVPMYFGYKINDTDSTFILKTCFCELDENCFNNKNVCIEIDCPSSEGICCVCIFGTSTAFKIPCENILKVTVISTAITGRLYPCCFGNYGANQIPSL